MSAAERVALLVLFALVALFVPFVPQTQSSGHFLGAHYQQSADASPTCYLFHCGSYVNPQLSARTGSGLSAVYRLSSGHSFTCNCNSRSSGRRSRRPWLEPSPGCSPILNRCEGQGIADSQRR